MKTWTILPLLALASTAPAAVNADPGSKAVGLSEVVGRYNARFSAPQLAVTVVRPEEDYAPQSAAIPDWLDGLGMSQQELRAITATVGVYAASPAMPPRTKSKSAAAAVASTLGSWALAIAAENARDRASRRNYRSSNTVTGDRALPEAEAETFAASPLPPAKELVPGRLVAFDTCGGALFSALTRLNQIQPQSPFTAFVRSVGGTAFSGPLRADPTCGMDAALVD